jgi:hypothetical protein
MSWLFSQALVEEYLVDTSLVGEQSVLLNGNNTQQAYCAPDKMTGFSRLSRFGMTFKPLTENLGDKLLMLFLEDFLAKTLVQQEQEQELMGFEAECGDKWQGSFTKFDPSSCSWKTHQCSLLGDLDEFSETWPQWGLMRDGECWEQQTLERHIRGTEFGLLQKMPTPTASDSKRTPIKEGYANKPSRVGTPDDLAKWALRDSGLPHGRLEPLMWEWMMGWPPGWTDLKPQEMDKYHCVQRLPGEF